MPRVLLKRFHNKNNQLCYYDVQKDVIGSKGSAKSINTELGYYSEQTENYFRDEIETPFGEILSEIERNDLSSETLVIGSKATHVVKNFIYALIARGPSFSQQMNAEKEFWQEFPVQLQHDVVAKIGIRIASENNILSDYFLTFMINTTEVPFVLSMDGIYSYRLNGYPVVNLPISPNMTVSLIHRDYSGRFLLGDDSVVMLEINDPAHIKLMNDKAFSSQVRRKWGYVVCPEKKELLRLSDSL